MQNTVPVRRGNQKLGMGIYTWSLPARDDICVGATAICREFCYAKKGHFSRTNVQEKYERNYQLSLTQRFESVIYSLLLSLLILVFRIHVSGEFYSVAYVLKWIRIAKRRKATKFYTYTRSWQDAEMLTALTELGRLPNVYLWFSADKDTGEPPRIPGIRVCYTQVDDNDIPSYPVDLFFRNKRKKVKKWINGSLVCPVENGVTKTTCSQCKLCFSDKEMPCQKMS